MTGSSPLSRGIPHGSYRRGSGEGIIPALAGNTLAPKVLSPLGPDHPRSRGEYVCDFRMGHLGEGSSPLSRGIL